MSAGPAPIPGAPGPPDTPPGPPAGHEPRAARQVRTAAEVVLLGLVAWAPWPYGSVTAANVFVLLAGTAALTALWAAHAVLTRRFAVRTDPVGVCLFGLLLLTAVQLVPLPDPVVRVVAPVAADWHRTLLPDVPELLPGEPDPGGPARPYWYPVSVDPAATRGQAVFLLAVTLVYAVVRNLIATKGSFRRLAWLGFGVGVALAVVGVCQAVSSPRGTVYWRYETPNLVFGPFINRNHYAYFANVCVGLGLGLLLAELRDRKGAYRPDPGVRRRKRDAALAAVGDVLRSPRAGAVAAGLGLMLATIPFSLSRGGTLAAGVAAVVTVVVARVGRRAGGVGGSGAAGWAVGAVAAVAVGLVGWFGSGPVEARLASAWTQRAHDDRWGVWRDAAPAAAGGPVVGLGAGTFGAVEGAYRRRNEPAAVRYSFAHNEYLGAAVEGGAVGFALTLGLAAAAVWVAAAGAVRLWHRSVGPLLLGAVYGLTAVAAHSVVDFGLRLPAVALLAAAVAGQVSAAAADTDPRVRRRVRRVRKESGDVGGEAERHVEARTRKPDGPGAKPEPVLTGSAAMAAGLLAAGGGLLVAWQGWQDVRHERATAGATLAVAGPPAVAGGPPEPIPVEVREDAVARYTEAAMLRPDDSDTWDALGVAHLRASRAYPPTSADARRHLAASVAATQEARARCPLRAAPHARLGVLAPLLARTDPPAVHFDRAKRAAPKDPEVWFLSGRSRLEAGDANGAVADWREALAVDRGRFADVLAAARGRLAGDDIRAMLPANDPRAWAAAADVLYPRGGGEDERREYLGRAVGMWAADPPGTADDWAAWAAAERELGRPDAALAVWRKAADALPSAARVRAGLAGALEDFELYDEAVTQLEWLADRGPGYRDRLDAARHALELRQEFDGR